MDNYRQLLIKARDKFAEAKAYIESSDYVDWRAQELLDKAKALKDQAMLVKELTNKRTECPYCGAIVPAEAKKCPDCGFSLPTLVEELPIFDLDEEN